MTALVFLVEQFALGLYILIGVGVLWAWRGLGQAQREYRATYYELERDIARYRRANAITALLLLGELGLIVLGVQRVVAPTVRLQVDVAARRTEILTDATFVTPVPARGQLDIDTAGVEARLLATDPAQAVLATPTLTPTPVGTILPYTDPPIGCDTAQATLQVPANGMVVFGPIQVRGQAFADDFAYYRFELRGQATFNNFALLQEYYQAAPEDGALGQFTPSFYQPGTYQFRLTVFDSSNSLRASCTVTIYISDPIPTPTPIGA